jgi:hypothetical protein
MNTFSRGWSDFCYQLSQFWFDSQQEGHDGPEVAHLCIGPRSGASLNPRAFIWTNLEDTHQKMFHDVKFLLHTYNEKQW